MSKIILLNGPSSAGKSSIVKAIQWISSKPWLSFGVDSFIAAMPSKYSPGGALAHEGINFISGLDENGHTITKVESGHYWIKISKSIRSSLQQLVNDGLDIIIDEVTWEKEELEEYFSLFKDHSICYVTVNCDLVKIEEREIIRGDRSIGLARYELPKIKNMDNYWKADLTIDTTNKTPFENAKLILDFLKNK